MRHVHIKFRQPIAPCYERVARFDGTLGEVLTVEPHPEGAVALVALANPPIIGDAFFGDRHRDRLRLWILEDDLEYVKPPPTSVPSGGVPRTPG